MVWSARIYLFRRLRQSFFLWRFHKERPPVVFVRLDTMGADDSEAAKRHGVKPTYKKGKGFPEQSVEGRNRARIPQVP